jgi:dTMP kinase
MLAVDNFGSRQRVTPGRLITIEGLDGAGKTTLGRSMEAALGARGVDVRLLREPGGVEASERIRELVKDPAIKIDARAEALLYAAARAQLVVEAIKPLLRGGHWVLLDRFIDSSLAYQGGGRGLGLATIRAINEFATDNLVPDRTLLLVVDPATGVLRSSGRDQPPDRLEQENDSFRLRIAAAYLELAAAEPARVRMIDANADPQRVLAAALDAVADLV